MRTIPAGVSILIFAIVTLAPGATLHNRFLSQDSVPAKVETDTFFSGTVIAMSADKVTVARAILGKPAEKRDFLMNGDTKVEGKLKAKCRVTVRFAAGDQGEVAISIIVRDKQEKKK